MQLKVETVTIVHDWVSFMAGVADTNLSNYAKLEETQHQWKFERHNNDPDFPLNVRVFYRSYAADETIVTKIIPKAEAKSALGTLTGMDHYLMQVKWLPDRHTIQNRKTDGFYLLRSLPSMPANLIPLKEYHKDAYASV